MILKNKRILKLSVLGLALVTGNQIYAGEVAEEVTEIQEAQPVTTPPYRPAIIFQGGVKSAISALKNQIEQLESEAVGVPTLKEQLDATNRQLLAVKNKLGLAALEAQTSTLKNQFDTFAQRFFKTAQTADTFLYFTLNEKITDLLDNPDIKRKLYAIIRLKQEIGEIMGNVLNEIKQLGSQINTMTQNDQRGLSALKRQLTMAENQFELGLSSDEARQKIGPLEQKVREVNEKIDYLLALRFTEDKLMLIERYKNRMRQYQIILDYLRDPSLIPLTTQEQVIDPNQAK